MQYSLSCLLSRGFVVTDRANTLFNALKDLKSNQYKSAERSLYQLVSQVEKDRFIDLAHQFQMNLKEFMKHENAFEEKYDNCHYVRRVIVTPTRCLFLPPELASGNRILRHYGGEYCLRVTFRDENFFKLTSYEASQAEEISRRVEKLLKCGIQVEKRHYEFLACSNSQLRDHGCWLYAKDKDGNCAADVRNWMGDFSKIKCVASYIARMGQCFSKSEETVNVSVEGVQVKREDDIKSSDGKYCFSDGTGKVSVSLAKKIAKALGKKMTPSAFQIRFRGCKGVVAMDPNLEGEKLVIRRSMEKFQSTHNRIEVMKSSQPCRLYLNRQAITLLSGLGVKDEVFRSLQEKMLFKLGRMLCEDEEAAKALKSQKLQRTNFNFKSLLDARISLTEEPFFRGLLLENYRNSISELQRKTRIEIPAAYGRNMIGVLDESGKLHYGQVFVQYSKDLDNPLEERVTLSGKVVVTKFPALHPGDMRKFSAVNIPELHHMIDCIVFPQRGKRPHPDEMAGSDLDGDEYFVTWLPELIFPNTNEIPMDFNQPSKVIHKGPIETSDMSRYVAEYIQNDKLGLVANAHLAQADKYGIFSDTCIQIAEIHAEAVDFAKTGWAPDLDREHRPYTYPDFMGKSDKSTYKSTGVLGDLFRQCRQISRSHLNKTQSSYDKVVLDNALIYSNWEDFKEDAEKILARYNKQLGDVLLQYGVTTESEALSGCIMRMDKLTQKNEIYEAKILLRLKLEDLHKKTRRDFFHEFGGEENHGYTDKVMAKASALYCVTYDQKDPTYLSCPWYIVGNLLCEIRKRSLSLGVVVTTDSTLQRWSFEAEAYRKYASEVISPNSSYCNQEGNREKIVECCQENSWIQPVVGVLLVWRTKRGLAKFITRTKLLSLLLITAIEAKYIEPITTKEGIHSNRNNGHRGTIKVAFSTAGSLLVNFFSFCAKYKDCKTDWRSFSVNLPKNSRQRLREEAERAYHQVTLFSTLQVIGEISEQESEIIEKTMKVSRAVYGVHKGVTRFLKETYPKVEVYFRPVKETSNTSDDYITLRGPRPGVHNVQDLIAEWTDDIPPELEDIDADSESEYEYDSHGYL